MYGDTFSCPDGKTKCNVSVVWKDSSEICMEFDECVNFPCNTTNCPEVYIPLPGYCQLSECWEDWTPVPPPPNSENWLPIIFGIIGGITLVSLVTVAIIFRSSPIMLKTWFGVKKTGKFLYHILEICYYSLKVIFLLILLPFAMIFLFLKQCLGNIYGKIYYRNQPDHPNRHDHIELNEILRSLESNGCWPPYTSDPHPHQPLVNDNVENGIENANSDIYIPRAGTSHEVVTEQPQSSTESLNLPPPMKKGKTKRKKSQKLEVEDPYNPKHVAIADNSKFSIGESGDEIDPKNDSKEKVGNNPFDSENGDEIDLKDDSSKNQNPFDSENDEGKEGDFYMDN